MIFKETTVAGAYIVEPRPIQDERGFFARTWCADVLRERGLTADIAQSNMAFSHRRGTLRGLHFQRRPHEEVKILRCTRGSVYDVVVDLRLDSPTYRNWFGVELSEQNRAMLYVPRGCATGYITLADETEICYSASEFYHPESASGVRYDDPAFGITWPIPPVVISEQDRQWPNYSSRSSQLNFAATGAGQ